MRGPHLGRDTVEVAIALAKRAQIIMQANTSTGTGFPKQEHPVALTIASSDSGAGAGIQADLLTFASQGVFGISALAALTAQNPLGVTEVRKLDPEFLQAQLDQLSAYFSIRAIKTGMLFSQDLIRVTAGFIKASSAPAVVDPVMVSSSGAVLLQPDAIETLVSELLPQAALITPNLDEAAALTGSYPDTLAAMRTTVRHLSEQFGTAVLLKGGHLPGNTLVDCLCLPEGDITEFEVARIQTTDTHGSGCTLSSAIAAWLARGLPLIEAVSRAHTYLQDAMRQPLRLGDRCFISHFPDPDKSSGDHLP